MILMQTLLMTNLIIKEQKHFQGSLFTAKIKNQLKVKNGCVLINSNLLNYKNYLL